VSLIELAAALLDERELQAGPVALARLVDTFATKHHDGKTLAARWDERPAGQSFVEWYAVYHEDALILNAITDLTLTVLFGALYVDRHVIDASDPAWAFVGRFWSLIESHPVGLSGGTFGHWRYGPGAQ